MSNFGDIKKEDISPKKMVSAFSAGGTMTKLQAAAILQYFSVKYVSYRKYFLAMDILALISSGITQDQM